MSALPIIPRSMPDPPPAGPLAPRTLERWDQFLGAVASGMGLPEAKMKFLMTTADIEACARINDLQMQRWDDAVKAGRKRKWSVFQYDDIFGLLAEGKTIKDAQIAVMGTYDPHFAQLIVGDPELNARYRQALEIRALTVVEEVIPIIDDDSKDTLDTLKGPIPNMAAVSRSKLKGETRLRVAGYYNSKLFGEKKDNVNVQVNIDHVGSLEAARERAKLQDKRVTPKQMAAAIDATFSEKTVAAPAEQDTSWMDEQPADAQWREES
jgi:hypothetical protein